MRLQLTQPPNYLGQGKRIKYPLALNLVIVVFVLVAIGIEAHEEEYLKEVVYNTKEALPEIGLLHDEVQPLMAPKEPMSLPTSKTSSKTGGERRLLNENPNLEILITGFVGMPVSCEAAGYYTLSYEECVGSTSLDGGFLQWAVDTGLVTPKDNTMGTWPGIENQDVNPCVQNGWDEATCHNGGAGAGSYHNNLGCAYADSNEWARVIYTHQGPSTDWATQGNTAFGGNVAQAWYGTDTGERLYFMICKNVAGSLPAPPPPASAWDFPEYNLNLHPSHTGITTTGPTGQNYYTCPDEGNTRLTKLSGVTVGACMQACVDDPDCHYVSIFPANMDTLQASGDTLWERPANFMEYTSIVTFCLVCDDPVPSSGNNNDNGFWTVWGEAAAAAPTDAPTPAPPTDAPTDAPTAAPTTAAPTDAPTFAPTMAEVSQTEEVVLDMDPTEFVGTVQTTVEQGYTKASRPDACANADCTQYVDGYSISSSIGAGTSRRLLNAGPVQVIFVVTLTGMDNAQLQLLNQGCTAGCDAAAIATAITEVATAASVTMPATFAVTSVAPPTVVSHSYVSVHPDRTCGDGQLEAIAPGHAGTCPLIGSQTADAGTVTPETCDSADSAAFGVFTAGCGTASSCALTTGQVVEVAEITTDTADGRLARSKQLQYGLMTSEMAEHYDYNPFEAVSATNKVPRINPCLYSTQLVKADGTSTSSIAEAAGCTITAADRVKYTSLKNCYDSTAVSAASTVAELAQFGARLTDANADYALYGHKCQHPAALRIDSVAGGAQTWTPTPRDPTSDKIIAPFDGLYDLCFSIQDPSWPAVHPSSFEFIQQMTRLQYEVVCDPLVQETAYPDPDGNCETNTDANVAGSYKAAPGQHSHKCTRLGNRANPCSNVHKLFELYSCDDSSCESLEGLASEYTDRFGATTEKGTKYTFEHDSAASKNKFQCTTKAFSNVNLTAAGFTLGDATQAQSPYVCATGGQATECDPGMGEIVHEVNTCSASGTTYKDIESLKSVLVPQNKWKDLSTLYNQIWDDEAALTTTAGSDAAVDCAQTPDDANCAVFKFYRDLQQYPVGCGRKLKMRVLKGVSGQVMLRVVVRNYNTAVDDADASRGYTYWNSQLLPVSVEAKVKPIQSTDNLGRDATAPTEVFEAGSLSFLSAGAATSPFAAMAVNDYQYTDEASRGDKFSRSTRTHLEIIECTNSNGVLAIESDESVPRFRLAVDAPFASTAFSGDFDYYPTYIGDAGSNRMYELSTGHSYEAPTVAQLKSMRPDLVLRAQSDFTANPDFWTEANQATTSLDAYHEGYSTNAGLCLKTRMYVFEPSTCDFAVHDSPEYHIAATPTNSQPPTVTFNVASQTALEDTTIPLKIAVNHASSATDSSMFYFSHIEIEDLNLDSYDAENGGEFELFSYGSTMGAVGGTTDAVTTKAGITKIAPGKWRSYANRCTKWIHEQGAQGGDASLQGGFSSTQLDTTDFASADDCLQDAQRQGEAIWGETGGAGKNGVHLRPSRKMTKNLQLRVTVFMYDGDVMGWHSTDSLEQSASTTVELLHIPAVTRYDQREILQADHTITENGLSAVTFNPAADRTDGIGLPLPYRAGTSLCTYIQAGADGSIASVDEIDATQADHDKICDPTGNAPTGTDAQGGDTCDGGNCYQFSGDNTSGCAVAAGFKVSCKATGAEASRAVIETLVLFDESEGANDAGDYYQDGSVAWTDGPMVMPEQISYQPAGNNPKASQDSQWYSLEACAGNAAIDNVYWCSASNSDGIDAANSATDLTGVCDITAKGAGADAIDGPGATTSALQNSLSIDEASGIILTDGTTMGRSQNFWILGRANANAEKFLSRGSLCFQGKSGFNTEDASYDASARSPINLRMVAVVKDSVQASSGVDATEPTFVARSKSNTDQGAFSVNVDHVRQLAVPSTLSQMWGNSQTADSASAHVSFIEERNLETRDQIDDTVRTWTDVATDTSGTLTEDLDCGGGNSSDTFCADRIRFTEQTNFHDQHIGRVKVTGYFQKTCGATAMAEDEWKPAGGLYDVFLQYVDDYPDFGNAAPGSGFYKVSDSHEVTCGSADANCASSIVQQEFTNADHGTQLVAGIAGGSVCRIILDDGLDSGQIASVRGTSCHIRDSLDVVGHNTFTWSDTILNRALVNKCHKPAGGSGNFVCPAGPLMARELASNLRFRLPHRWSNCIRMKFDVTVSNDDRVKPAFSFSEGTGGTFVDFQSSTVSVIVQPKPIAEQPVMWVGTDLADASGCLGSNTVACAGSTGTAAIGDLQGGYSTIDANTNLDGSGAMTQLTMVAGYRSQVRVLAASGATDNQAEAAAPIHPLTTDTNYAWDSLRSLHDVSGEHVYLTVQSKYSDMVTGASNQRFCLWLCPVGTPEGQGCQKSQLIRIKPLPETGADFTAADVNCQTCTGTTADGCYETGSAADGSPIKCLDPYARDATLLGCPTYSAATPYHNPSSLYSFKCSKSGSCPELKNLYVQYPADQITDDVLEISAWSRNDWRGSAGFQRSRVSMNILMKPSITLSEVGFGIEATTDCDPDATGACATGFFGAPLQPSQAVTVVPSVDPPITIGLFEGKLHGVDGSTSIGKCQSLIAVADLSSKGSLHDVTTQCGLRFPVSFADSDLMAVAPIGIRYQLRAGVGIEAKQLAQAMQMLCTQYSRDSTGAQPNTCVGQFTAISPTSAGAEQVDLLRFQSADGTSPDPTTRLLDFADFQSSQYPASHLSWDVGELMTQKEMVLFGSDDNAYSLSDYSFDNHRCENDRLFQVDITHQTGYAPSVVAESRSSITVKVEDDDFYGVVQMAGVQNNQLRPLTDLDASYQSASLPKLTWNSDGVDQPFSVYLQRSRLSSESNTAAKRALDMKPLTAWVKVDLGGLNTNEFSVSVSKIHGNPDQNIETYTLTSAEVVAGDGTTGYMIRVDMPAATPGQNDCKLCDDANGPCYYYNCEGTEGAADRSVPFQFFKISILAAGPASGCFEGGNNAVSFSLEKVDYTAAAGTALDATEITCGTDVARNPLSTAEKAMTFTQTLTVTAEDPQSKAPFRVDFAGFDPEIEGAKEKPLSWNAGLDGSYLSIMETEHSDCTASGSNFACAPREFKMHICTTLRDVDAGTTWNEWAANTFRFFTEIEDSTDMWSRIDNYYQLACPTSAELVAMSNAAVGASVECSEMSSLQRQLATRQVAVHCAGTEYDAMSASDKHTYCNADVPRRLLWKVTTVQNGGRNAFVCPTTSTATQTGASNPWTALPFARFTSKDDGGIVNLSRRPKLILTNAPLPDELASGANTDTCSTLGTIQSVDLRIQDDELFAQNNALLDSDTRTMEASFSEPTWDSQNGKLTLNVLNRYYHGPQEKTLVNVQLGGCEPEIEANPSSSVNLRSFWEQYDGSAVSNPITSGSSMGSCDFLHPSNFPQGQGNSQMFAALFGDSSAQPDATETATLSANGKLFGFDQATDGVQGTNTLFTQPRDLGAGGSWTVSEVAIDNHGNSDLSTVGFQATLSVSLERLQACSDRLGRDIVSISAANGNTVYEFKLSSTHVTAMRKGDSSFAHYSPICTERSFSLSVSNTMFALSGMQSSGSKNAMYVDTVSYKAPAQGACTAHTDCDNSIGPQHACPASAGAYDAATLKALQYTVNMDMRTISNTVGGVSVNSYYGIASTSEVQVNSGNCYGAAVTNVDALSASGTYNEAGVTRTKLSFQTGCMELRPFANGEFGVPVADAFATCAANNAQSTDFSFKARVWECTNEAGLLNPTAAASTCQLLPDWLHVSIAIAFTEAPIDVSYEVEFESRMQLYRSFDHRLPDGSFPTATARDAWRTSNALQSTAAEPYATYPIDSMMSASLGFVANSALEAVMTTAIRQVRLCRFKEFCHLAGISTNVAGAPACSWDNTIVAATHSPLANWARNPTLDGGAKGCAETGAGVACAVTTKQTTVALPQLTCDRVRWEDFAISEAQAIMASTVFQSNFLDNIAGGVGQTLQVATLVQAFDPTIEAMLLVDHGATTTLAESIYGNCEKNTEKPGTETITDATGVYADMDLHHIFPSAPADGASTGACTCKGQRAYDFSPDGGTTNPYRNSAARKVIYDTQYFSSSADDEASLHKCTWMSPPQHSTSNTPLNSVDQFTMSLEFLKRGEGYFFEMNAVQYDHQAFTAAELADANTDQFALGAATARRLLATNDQHGQHAHTTQVTGVPRAALQQLARKKAASGTDNGPQRRMLSTMLPVSDRLSTTAVMPQGPLKIQGADTTGSFASQSTAGFIVQGPTQDHSLSKEEIRQDLNQGGSSLSDIYDWMVTGSFEGMPQLWDTVKVAVPSDSFNHFGEGMWTNERWRASIAVGPWIALLLLAIELVILVFKLLPKLRSRGSEVPEEAKWLYARNFFYNKSEVVSFDKDHRDWWHVLGFIFNESARVLGGYYVLAFLLVPIGWAGLILFALELKFAPPKEGRAGLRCYTMRFVQCLMDGSATQVG